VNPDEAVRSLRQHIGESQQAFATRLGLSIRAIANYEAGRRPTGYALRALEAAAQDADRPELAAVFRAALADELKSWDPKIEHKLLSAYTPTEKLLVAALLRALRKPAHAKFIPQIAALLEEPIDEVTRHWETVSLDRELRKRVDEMLNAGKTPEEISQALPLAPLDEIKSRASLREMKHLSQFFATLNAGKTPEEIKAAVPADVMKRFEKR
jgi:transcriptional regulator with XRE-family HTH domain